MASGIAPDVLANLDEWWLGALAGAVSYRWGAVEELLALTAELLHAQLAAFRQVHGRPGAQSLQPLRIPRPDPDSDRPRSSSVDEIHRFFGRGGTRHGRRDRQGQHRPQH